MGSWVSVFYEEICPGNSTDFTVNILAVSHYLLWDEIIPASPNLCLQIRSSFVRECLQQEWQHSSFKNVLVDIQRRTSSCPRWQLYCLSTKAQEERTASAISSSSFPSAAENCLARARALWYHPDLVSKQGGRMNSCANAGQFWGTIFAPELTPRGSKALSDLHHSSTSPSTQFCFLKPSQVLMPSKYLAPPSSAPTSASTQSKLPQMFTLFLRQTP